MRNSTRVCGYLILLALGFAQNAKAQWCPLVGPWEQGVSRIPIYVSLDGGAFNGNPSASEIARSVAVTAAEFAEHTNANIDFYYAGLMQDFPGSIAGAIVIHSSTTRAAEAIPFDTDQNGRIDRCNIFLNAFNTGFASVLDHEIEHCLGLHHSQHCTDEQALVNNGNESGGSFRSYDVRNLEALYGLRSQPSVFLKKFDSSFQTWTGIVEAPTAGWETARGGVATCNSFSLGGGRMAFTSNGAIFYGRVGTSTFTQVDKTPAGGQVATQRPAIACGPDGSFLVSWVAQPTLSTSRQVHRLVTPSQVVDIEIPGTGALFVGDVLSSTYDPSSGRYLVAFTSRSSFGTGDFIRIYLYGGADYAPELPIQPAGRPAIACAPVAMVGANNCLVAWIDGGWRSVLKYGFGRVGLDSGGLERFILDQSTIADAGLVVVGTPAVAFSGSPSTPWLLSAMLNDQTLRVWTRGASGGWTAKSDASINFGFSFVSPSLMTYQYQTCLPLWGCATWSEWRVYGRTFRH